MLTIMPGFDQSVASGEAKARMRKRGQLMWDQAADWLFREVYVLREAQHSN
jgi:hypothetical protein